MAKHPGQILREARNARSLSLEKVSRETRIRQHHLQAIEDGDLTVLPSEAQARGFIRVYAQYLGLQPDALSLAGDHQDDPAPQLLAADRAAAPPPPDGELKSAQEIFAEIGQQLRQQREILGFSLDDVEGQIHVRTHYLKAIEAGEVSRLPSPVQGRGMLSNYTSFLGLDSDAVLLRFADGLQAQLAAKKAAQTRPSSRRRLTLPRRLRWILSGDLIFGGIIISLLIGFFIWGAVRITSMRAQEQIPPTAPSLVELLRPSPSAPPAELTPTSNAAEQVGSQLTTTPEATVLELPELPDAAVQVQIVVRQRAWMRVIVDGQTAFEGRAGVPDPA